MKQTGRVAFLFLLWASGALAQSRDGFAEWQKKEQEAFQQFKDQRDREFLSFLQQDWQEMQAFQGIVQDQTPKPAEAPVAVVTPHPVPEKAPPSPPPSPPSTRPATPVKPTSPREDESVAPPSPPVKPVPPQAVEPVVPPTIESTPPRKDEPVIPPSPPVKPAPPQTPGPGTPRPSAPVEPVPAVPPGDAPQTGAIDFDFFGVPGRIACDPSLKTSLSRPLSEAAISAFWKTLSLAQYETCLTQAQEYRDRLHLNDWGYYQFLYRLGARLYEGERDRANLFVWFMLSKSGYAARVGYDQDHVYLLLPTEQTLFSTSYFTFDNTRFYAVSPEGASTQAGSLFTYEGNYPGADKRIDLQLDRPPQIGDKILAKTFQFRFAGQDYQVPVQLEQGSIDFFASFPQTEVSVYFRSFPSPEARASLVQALKPFVAGKSAAQAVDLLLCFVQTAFEYQIDDQQFGREKPLFVEETLFYPYSDCEDRSILFAFLVRELLGLEVIGLDYPGHIATAVRFQEPMVGDYVVYHDQQYTICDPTYINATLGMAMPDLKDQTPQVISIGL